jgi:restriction system protein
MNVWLIRAGSTGDRENLALDDGLSTIGWAELGNLSRFSLRDEVIDALAACYPDAGEGRLRNWASQIWAFYSLVQKGDIVAMPLKKRAAIALGIIRSDYRYIEQNVEFDACHARDVDWRHKDIPRAAFPQDLLYSLGAFLTVGRISRNDAAIRIQAILDGAPTVVTPDSANGTEDAVDTSAPEQLDVERIARDTIARIVGKRFKGHELERLVAAVLVADGYTADRTRAGADGGVDILAGRGELGFDAPRICVQVKSSDYPEDVKAIRELQGALKNFGAEHGLFVSWGGFKSSVYAEGRRQFFQVRLWDADDLIDAILRVYDRLPGEIRGELPLKRVWAPVTEGL